MQLRFRLMAFAIIVAGGASGAGAARADEGDPVYCCKSGSSQCCGTGGCVITNSGCGIIGNPAPGPPPSAE
jgi:hypothetical protein